jgi:hypothetical protein
VAPGGTAAPPSRIHDLSPAGAAASARGCSSIGLIWGSYDVLSGRAQSSIGGSMFCQRKPIIPRDLLYCRGPGCQTQMDGACYWWQTAKWANPQVNLTWCEILKRLIYACM